MKKFTYSSMVNDDWVKKHPDYLHKKFEHRNDPNYWYPGEFWQSMKDCWWVWVFGVLPTPVFAWIWVDMGCPIPLVCGRTWIFD